MTIDKDEITNLVTLDGVLLDDKDFANWLELYTTDCVFWMPAWDDDLDVQTSDPDKEISLIYYKARAGLADRIFRINTNRSSSSKPLFRTAHLFSNLYVMENKGDECTVRVSWVTHVYRHQKSTSYFGSAIYKFIRIDGCLKIKYKRVNLLNDYFGDVLDFYMV